MDFEFENGDIIITRSHNKLWNFIPGFWNHVGIYVEIEGFGYTIEALPLYGVIMLPRYTFFSRSQNYTVLRHKNNQVSGRIATFFALQKLGSSYSLFRKNQFSCVSLAKACYVTPEFDLNWWFKPDDMLNRLNESQFSVVYVSEDLRDGK